jgi:hypothetical protein
MPEFSELYHIAMSHSDRPEQTSALPLMFSSRFLAYPASVNADAQPCFRTWCSNTPHKMAKRITKRVGNLSGRKNAINEGRRKNIPSLRHNQIQVLQTDLFSSSGISLSRSAFRIGAKLFLLTVSHLSTRMSPALIQQ